MRAVLWLTAAFAIFYGGYWVVGARALREGIETALSDLRAAGLADYGGFDLSGFPSRFDMVLTAPELTSADGTIGWTAPALQVYALSYKPHHIIAVMPPTQRLRIGREDIAVISDDLRASAVFGLDPALPLDRAQAVGKGLALRSDLGWGFEAGEVRLALRQGATPREHALGAELIAMTLTGPPAALLTQGGTLPATGDQARLDAVLTLDRPLDRFAPEAGIRITGAGIRAIELDWGPAQLRGSGQITVTPTGQPEGRIDLSVRNWRTLLPLVTSLGLVTPEVAPTVENALAQLALAGGDAAVLPLPLVFSGGRMSLGPIPLGPAPRF